MSMRKRCPACGHLNADVEVVCTACGASLAYAEEVYGDPPPGTPSAPPVPSASGEPQSAATGFAGLDAAQATAAAPMAANPVGQRYCSACGRDTPDDAANPGLCMWCLSPRAVVVPPVPPDVAMGANPLRPGAPAPAPAPMRQEGVPIARLHWPGAAAVLLGEGQLVGREAAHAPPHLLAAMQAAPTLSRVHAWIGVREGQLTVIDLGSHNGTWVGSQRLTPGRPWTMPLGREGVCSLTICLGPSLAVQVTWEWQP